MCTCSSKNSVGDRVPIDEGIKRQIKRVRPATHFPSSHNVGGFNERVLVS